MEREKFMQEARRTAHTILEGKENGIMNLVQRAWAEGKRNAEVETLRAAIDEALDRREAKKVPEDAVYPTWREWLICMGLIEFKIDFKSNLYNPLVNSNKIMECLNEKASEPIPADMAEKLGLEPKGES